MRKIILALAIPTASIMLAPAYAQNVYSEDGNSLDVLGRVEINAIKQSGSSGDMTGKARIGLEGTTKVNEDVSLFGLAEWDLTGENSTQDEIQARYMYLGADFGAGGKISFGHQYTAMYNSLVTTVDIFEQWGMEAQDGLYGESRVDGLVVYSNNFGPFSIETDYQFHDEHTYDAIGIDTDNTDADGNYLSSNYDQNNAFSGVGVLDTGVGLNLRLAYAHQNYGDGGDINTYGAGADYTINNFYLAFVYLGARADNGKSSHSKTNTDSYNIAGSYTIDQFRLYGGYGEQHRSGSTLAESYTSVRTFVFGTEYNLTSNALVWLELRHNNGDTGYDYNGDAVDALSYSSATDQIDLSAQYNF